MIFSPFIMGKPIVRESLTLGNSWETLAERDEWATTARAFFNTSDPRTGSYCGQVTTSALAGTQDGTFSLDIPALSSGPYLFSFSVWNRVLLDGGSTRELTRSVRIFNGATLLQEGSVFNNSTTYTQLFLTYTGATATRIQIFGESHRNSIQLAASSFDDWSLTATPV